MAEAGMGGGRGETVQMMLMRFDAESGVVREASAGGIVAAGGQGMAAGFEGNQAFVSIRGAKLSLALSSLAVICIREYVGFRFGVSVSIGAHALCVTVSYVEQIMLLVYRGA